MSRSLEFSHDARVVAAEARASGLDVPGFRSPPLGNGDVSVTEHPPGRWMVGVRIADRSRDDVRADMVEGVIRANRLSAGRARIVRHDIFGALSDHRSSK